MHWLQDVHGDSVFLAMLERIRMALGARVHDVIAMLALQTSWMVGIGLAAGRLRLRSTCRCAGLCGSIRWLLRHE